MLETFQNQGVPGNWLQDTTVGTPGRRFITVGWSDNQEDDWKSMNNGKEFPKTAQDLFPEFVEIIKTLLIKPENFVQSNLPKPNSSKGSITIIDI